MRPGIVVEQRGFRFYAYAGACGGYGDTPEEAIEQLFARLDLAKRVFTVMR